MPNPAPPKKVSAKGKPMGIPMWGWVIAAVLGIVIGYTILKKSGGASLSADSAQSADDAAGFAAEEDKAKGEGNIGLPLEEILKALGLRGSSSVTSEGSGDGGSSESSSNESAVAETFTQESQPDNTDNPLVDEQGYLPGMNPATSMNDAFSGQFPIAPGSTFGPSPYVDYTSINAYLESVAPWNQTSSPSAVTRTTQSVDSMPGSTPVAAPAPIIVPASGQVSTGSHTYAE